MFSGQGMSNSDREREARLAAALRDNLKRRKAQARDSQQPQSTKPEPKD